MQWAWDPGDPINSAPFLIDPARRLPGVPPKRILMHEGLGDIFVPNAQGDALARVIGLPDANATRGCANSAGCSGIWRFDPAVYGIAPSLAHFVTNLIPEAQAQAARFLLSGGSEIIDATRQ